MYYAPPLIMRYSNKQLMYPVSQVAQCSLPTNSSEEKTLTTQPAPSINPEQQQLFEDFKTAAQIVDAPFDETIVSQLFNTYQQFFVSEPTETSVMMRIDTQATNRIALRYTDFSVPHDPFSMALENGLIGRTGHPMEELIPQIQEKVEMMGYGIDFSSDKGFEKIWPYFKPITIDDLHDLPTVPQASRDLIDYYRKYDLRWVNILGVDYRAKTMNVYFFQKAPGRYSPEEVAAMFADLGMEQPSDEELQICSNALVSYYTFDWDSPGVQRLCFCIPLPQQELVPPVSPLINKFITEIPVVSDTTGYMFCATYGKNTAPYFKMEVDYSGKIGGLMVQVLASLK